MALKRHPSTYRRGLQRGLLLLAASVFLLGSARFAVADPDIAPAPAVSPLSWIGEQINYHVAFGIVPAGKAQLAVIGTDTINGQVVLHAVSTARSAKAFDVVFKVRDTVESWFDADSIYSHRFKKRLQEGKYRDEKRVEFDIDRARVRWWDDGRERDMIDVEPSRVQDVLSAGYKARMVDYVVGDTFAIRTHDVNKTYDLLVIIHGRETIETPAGKFDTFKMEPMLRSGGVFKKEKGARVFVWVTADERRIPVQMQSKVSFGSVTAVMESYTPGQGMK